MNVKDVKKKGIEELSPNFKNPIFKLYSTTTTKDLKLKFSQINIFVGANNSGKSLFLRELYKTFVKSFPMEDIDTLINNKVDFSLKHEGVKKKIEDEIKEESKDLIWAEMKYENQLSDSDYDKYKPEIDKIFKNGKEDNFNENDDEENNYEENITDLFSDEANENTTYEEQINTIFNKIGNENSFFLNYKALENYNFYWLTNEDEGYLSQYQNHIDEEDNGNEKFDFEPNLKLPSNQKIKNILDRIDEHIKSEQKKYTPRYIPILRGIKRPIFIDENGKEIVGENVYKNKTVKDYFSKKLFEKEEKKEEEKNKKVLIEIKKAEKIIKEFDKNDNTKEYFESELRKLKENENALKEIKEKNENALQKIKKLIFTGENLYLNIKGKLLSELKNRELIKDFEKFIGNTFFEKKEITLIPYDTRGKEKELYIKIGNEDERPIHEIGDGILSVLILLYPLFLTGKEKTILLIEEPELNLHPGMQRIFIETLRQFPEKQIFITTHSNHFLDMSLEQDNISIFSFQKEKIENKNASFQITTLNSPNSNILNQLGVRNSSVFLSNCTIWVEGITDRKYIKKHLELYEKSKQNDENFITYREDIHYSFVEYSGSNIVHWNFDEEKKDEEKKTEKERIFAASISNRIFLIADSDYSKNKKTGKFEIPEAKEKRFEKLDRELKGKFYQLKVKEIENTLSPKIIKGIIADYENKEILDFKEIKFKEKDYEKEGLGEFIDDKFKNIINRTYKDNNTIRDKGNFCDKAIKIMNNNNFKFSDLSKEAQCLSKKIYKFIGENNGIVDKERKKQ